MKNLYVIYDVLGEEAGPVFEAPNEAVARRAADQLLAETPEKYRDSFLLYKVGEIDDKGQITSTTREEVENAEII